MAYQPKNPNSALLAPLSVAFLRDSQEEASAHPNILHRSAAINITYQGDGAGTKQPIGCIKAQLCHLGVMRRISPGRMQEECEAYDADPGCAPKAKLNKLANLLENQSFLPDIAAKLGVVERILYVEEVFIQPHPSFRGQGYGLLALDLLLKALQSSSVDLVILQAAPLSVAGRHGTIEGQDKLVKYWGLLGFEGLSDSDDAWLGLWTGDEKRPKIEGVIPHLFQKN